MPDLLPDRIQPLNNRAPAGQAEYVVYWMEQSKRARHNPALERGLHHANEHDLPLLVVVGLMDEGPEANLRHYTFVLEGLRETQQRLAARGLQLVVQHGPPDEVALRYADNAAVLVTDRGYLRHQKQWRARVAEAAPCRVEQVEGDVVVPVETATDKAEYAARTLRPKIHEHLDRCLQVPPEVPVETPSLGLDGDAGLDLSTPGAVLDALGMDRSVAPVSSLYRGGAPEAERILDDFLGEYLEGYDENRNQIHSHAVSHMSKYLHAGQISPVWLARQVQQAGGPEADTESYIEELVVRRELAVNHVHFRPDTYDAYDCLPEWARESLAEHAEDEREYLYSRAELEQGDTHDPYWNAAMKEMRETGYMHNYMRMYWGKKILEWSPDPHTAYRWTLDFNNTYFLDGRDPNSFANVAWVFGLHDRGWKERPVYGKVRYMSQGGLKRKADPDAYVKKVDRLAARAQNG